MRRHLKMFCRKVDGFTSRTFTDYIMTINTIYFLIDLFNVRIFLLLTNQIILYPKCTESNSCIYFNQMIISALFRLKHNLIYRRMSFSHYLSHNILFSKHLVYLTRLYKDSARTEHPINVIRRNPEHINFSLTHSIYSSFSISL